LLNALKGSSSSSDKGFFASLFDNPIFSAGAGVVGLTAGIALLRQSSLFGLQALQKRLTTSLEVRRRLSYLDVVRVSPFISSVYLVLQIPRRDRSYSWLLKWLGRQPSRRSQHLSVETSQKLLDDNKTVTRYNFVPSLGTHWVRYKKNWIRVERERDTKAIDLSSGQPWETVKLTAFTRDTSVFRSLLRDAKMFAREREKGKTVVYSAHGGIDWQYVFFESFLCPVYLCLVCPFLFLFSRRSLRSSQTFRTAATKATSSLCYSC
jgi:chaperone BCS1